MMRCILILLMAMVSHTAFSQLQWKETEIDYGTFDETDGVVERKFECKNIGTYPIDLVKVRSSCGCIVADFKKTILGLGETYVLPVKYNPDRRPGYFDKAIFVSTPDQTYKLSIRGNVRPSASTTEIRFPIEKKSIRLMKDMVSFRKVVRGRQQVTRVSGCNVSDDTIKCQLLELPMNVDFDVYPDVIPPKNVFTMKFTFQSDTTVDFGLFERTVKLRLGKDVLSIPVSASVVAGENDKTVSDKNAPKVEIDTPKFVFDGYGNAETLHGTFKISNVGARPLVVNPVSSQHMAIEVRNNKKLEILPGDHKTIRFEINTSLIENKILNSELIILTNDPFNSAAKVRIVGMK